MTCLVLSELFLTNLLLFEHQQKKNPLVSWQFSGPYGVTEYSSGWRKDVVNQSLEFDTESHNLSFSLWVSQPLIFPLSLPQYLSLLHTPPPPRPILPPPLITTIQLLKMLAAKYIQCQYFNTEQLYFRLKCRERKLPLRPKIKTPKQSWL